MRISYNVTQLELKLLSTEKEIERLSTENRHLRGSIKMWRGQKAIDEAIARGTETEQEWTDENERLKRALEDRDEAIVKNLETILASHGDISRLKDVAVRLKLDNDRIRSVASALLKQVSPYMSVHQIGRFTKDIGQ